MIDWLSPETSILFNPKTPRLEVEGIERLLPKLPAHLWLSTSGTSGKMKWVALAKDAILASAEAVNRHLSSVAQDVWIHVLPEFHVGGIGIRARAHLSGASVVPGLSKSGWSASRFAQLSNESRATLSALVPTQIHDLVKEGLRAPSSMRAIIVGGGALSEGLYFEARKLGWPLLPSYGLTECCSQVATAELSSLSRDEFPDLKVLSHLEASISETQRIRVRGRSLLTGYFDGTKYKDPKIDGWFETEDLGNLNPPGFLEPRGRGSSFIKIGGESVDLNRLENFLAEAVLTAKFPYPATIAAVPDERLGHVVHLVVAARPSGAVIQETEGLSRAFSEKILPFEKPRAIRYVEAIPRTALGKILKQELSALLSQSP